MAAKKKEDEVARRTRLAVGTIGFILFAIGLVGICGLTGAEKVPYILPLAFGIAAMYMAGDKTEGIW